MRWLLVSLITVLGMTQQSNAQSTATFAAGCFWCIQQAFDNVPGVTKTVVGYTGGRTPNPDYESISSGVTGHAEAVEVHFDPTRVSYLELLEVFWKNIDPFAKNRQFCDVGSQYRTAIFTHSEDQLREAQATREEIESSPRFAGKIATEITPATVFYPAEDYHQQFYKKSPERYTQYKEACGRKERLKEVWEGL